MYTYIYMYTYTYVHIHTYKHMNTYIYTYTWTHTGGYTNGCSKHSLDYSHKNSQTYTHVLYVYIMYTHTAMLKMFRTRC